MKDTDFLAELDAGGIKPDRTEKTAAGGKNEENEKSELLPVEKAGLYKVLYIDEKPNAQIKKISKCLKHIPSGDLKDAHRKEILTSLLSDLFTSVSHLIKDSAYEHEHEYRLMHIGSIEDDRNYIKASSESNDLNIHTGIYIETEPILFSDPEDREVIYFGPKVDGIAVLRARHIFEYEDLHAEIRESKIKYR
ncbi:DUF2971 domain-containing protein [Brucepastera parasyntrophica]|uniref:DUF2971 domain-containing protein n=1 Tax=Brucepastera parasyntrophica TaxID=2880008 RepID=UPI00210BA3F6|nr:DUF2971 domain-containing protein [Brucepastera parasyntrophica]ULQ60474.1 DUF2971 domain-containing protein [Brucepastera parasyntrophica]